MHILLVETTSVRGFDIVEELADAGIEVTFVAQDLARHRTLHDPAAMARAARLIEVPQLGQGCDLAGLLAGRWGPNRPDGVICRDEVFAPDVARLTAALGLRGESADTARRLGDKSAVRDCLTRAGIGTLRWRCVGGRPAGTGTGAGTGTLADALAAAAEIGYPLVVKPVSGGFSLGVSIVHDEAGLRAALDEAARGSAAQPDRQALALIEEFAPGRLVSAELLVQDGTPHLLGFAERDPCPSGVTAEVGGHFPARFDGLERAREFAEAVVRALGVRDSAVHMEMMITPHGPELVEVNGRVAGHVVLQQMSLALGRSVAMDLVAVATGRPLAPFGEPVATVALRQLFSERAGTVRRVDLPSDLGNDVPLHGVTLRPGQRVAPLASNRDRFGFVLAMGLDPADATQAAADAARRLREGIAIDFDDGTVAFTAATPMPMPAPAATPLIAAACAFESASAAEASAPASASAPVRPAPADPRTHVLLLDRVGPDAWTRRNGSPLLPPERYRVSVLTAATDTQRGAPVDHLQALDVFDAAAVDAAADALHTAAPVQRVATLSERLLLPAARLRRRWAAPGDSPVRVNRFIDKAVMKQIARGAGIRCAGGQVLRSAGELARLMDAHGTLVVKPRASSGSQGVAVLRDAAQAAAWCAAELRPGEFLAEPFVAGAMCHIDALVWHDLRVWDVSCYLSDTMAYQRGQPLSSVTVGDPSLRAAAGRLLDQVIDAWEVSAAVLHLEAFVDPANGALTFCEVAARPGGAGVVEAFEATRGVNLDHAKILLDCGEDPRRLFAEPVAEHAGYTVHYSAGGVLEHYDDSSVAGAAFHRRIAVRPGQAIARSRFSGTGISTHIFARRTPHDVLELIRRAETGIRYRVRPTPHMEIAR